MSMFSYYDVQNGEGEESLNTASFASNNANNTASGSNLEMQAISDGMLGGQRRVRWMMNDRHAVLPDIPDYTATETQDSFMEGSATKDSFMEGTTTSSRSTELKTERSSPLFMDKSNSSIKTRLSEDEFGFTGFHKLCCAPQEGQDDPLWSDVRDALRDLVRNGKEKDVLVMTQGVLDNVPLHLVCFRNPPIDIIERLIKLSPESVWMPDRDTDLAIHYACRNQGTTRVIKLIADSFPESVEFRGENGDTPLGCIIQQCVSTDESLPDPELIRILATPKVLSMADTSDNKPFDLFLMMCANIKHTTPDVEWQAKESLYAFFDCQPGTISVISSFKRMPLWLFRHTLSHSYVRRIIDEQVTYPIPTMILMLDVFANLLLIVSYVSALSKSDGLSGGGASLTTDSQWETICLELGVGYMILHKLFQLCVVTSWKFAPEWFFDVWNWFDVVVIVLIIITTRFVTGTKFFLIPMGGDSPLSWNIDVIQILVTITAGLIWIKLISCLRLIRPSFSNFTCYFVNVVHTLIPYILFTAIVLGAFASMFYVDSLYLTSNAVEGDDDDDRFGYSTLSGAFLKTYVMFVNANISDGEFITHASTKWLSVFFSLVMILLLINVLVAVIVVAFGGSNNSNDKSQRNINNIFWMNRFILVIESYALKGIFLCGDNNPPRRVGAGIDNELDFEPESGIGAYFDVLQRSIEYIWDTSQTLLTTTYFKQWNDQQDESGSDQFVSLLLNITSASLNLVFKLITLIFIVTWIVLGFATTGLLWPYQIRAWLFCPGLTKYDIQHKRIGKLSDESEQIISELKRYVDNQSNMMTTERNDMEKRMNERMKSMDQTIDKIYEVLVQFNMALIEKKNT